MGSSFSANSLTLTKIGSFFEIDSNWLGKLNSAHPNAIHERSVVFPDPGSPFTITKLLLFEKAVERVRYGSS